MSTLKDRLKLYLCNFSSISSDYEALAPASSFIHVDQFDSVVSLARHLENVASNETLFKVSFLLKLKLKWRGGIISVRH